MDASASGTCKQKQAKGEAVKKGSQVQSGKSLQYNDIDKRTPLSDEKERPRGKPSKFPSLSKLGRSHTFSFGRKKDKDNERRVAGKTGKVGEKNMDKRTEDSRYKDCTRRKSKESYTSDEKVKNNQEQVMNAHGKSVPTAERFKAQNDYTRARSDHTKTRSDHTKTRSDVRHYELARSRSYDSRVVSGGKENRTREHSSSSGKHVAGKDVREARRRDCKRKELPVIDHGYGHNNIAIWLQNPPKILIQDFSSDYVDEMSFDEEYFDLVQWAFRILEQHFNYRMYSRCVDFHHLTDDEPTLLGAGQKEPLKVITTETARVGSTLDYILHPISTGAANMIQTGAKFADFTSRVFRGINFDSIIRKRNDHEAPSKK